MNRRSGFTLVELLVVLALTSVVLAVAGAAIFSLQRSTLSNRLLNQQQEAMTRTLQQIVAQVKESQATSLVAGTTLNPVDVRFELPPLTSGGAAREFVLGYQANGGVVWLGESGRAVCSHIEQLRLDYDTSKHLLTIYLKSEESILGIQRGLPIVMETSVVLRNAAAKGGG